MLSRGLAATISLHSPERDDVFRRAFRKPQQFDFLDLLLQPSRLGLSQRFTTTTTPAEDTDSHAIDDETNNEAAVDDRDDAGDRDGEESAKKEYEAVLLRLAQAAQELRESERELEEVTAELARKGNATTSEETNDQNEESLPKAEIITEVTMELESVETADSKTVEVTLTVEEVLENREEDKANED